MYIYIETSLTAEEVAKDLESLDYNTFTCTSDREVFVDWCDPHKKYEDKKQPTDNDWQCQAGIEEI